MLRRPPPCKINLTKWVAQSIRFLVFPPSPLISMLMAVACHMWGFMATTLKLGGAGGWQNIFALVVDSVKILWFCFFLDFHVFAFCWKPQQFGLSAIGLFLMFLEILVSMDFLLFWDPWCFDCLSNSSFFQFFGIFGCVQVFCFFYDFRHFWNLGVVRDFWNLHCFWIFSYLVFVGQFCFCGLCNSNWNILGFF